MGAMADSTAAGGCSPGDDAVFGPQVNADCRPFDFTLLFEDALFVALPAAVFLLLMPARLRSLRKETVKSQSYKLLTWKLVLGPPLLSSFYLDVADRVLRSCSQFCSSCTSAS